MALPCSWAGQPQSVLLLLTDSVFEPEDWSRTFLEGCLRRPASGWKDAEAIEVGTGYVPTCYGIKWVLRCYWKIKLAL